MAVGSASAGLACGGANDTGLFGGAASGSGAADSGGGPTFSDGGTSGGDKDASSGGEDSGEPHKDAGAPVDAGPAKDSAPPPPQDQGVKCGNVYCPVPEQACCRRTVAGNDTFTCMPTGQCQGLSVPSLEIPCDDSTDCTTAGMAGDVCCVTVGGGGGGANAASEVTCRAPADCTQQTSMTPMCDPTGPNDCPQGTTCRASTQTLKGYDLCF